eukprot:scaffold440085_cov35-Prasinocladus_malaysianus.AAC.2
MKKVPRYEYGLPACDERRDLQHRQVAKSANGRRAKHTSYRSHSLSRTEATAGQVDGTEEVGRH